MGLTYEVRGTKKLVRKLDKIAGVLRKDVTKTIQKFTIEEAADLRQKKYPPRLPDQKYIRTGLLGRSFHDFRRGKTIFGVYNDTPYGKWVIWKGMQAPIHAGRWWTFQQTVQTDAKRLMRQLNKLIGKQVDK